MTVASMSLIGPRPHPLALDDEFSTMVPELHYRHAMKSGISGLAQVGGHRGETKDAAAMRGRVTEDLRHIQNWSLRLDRALIARALVSGWRHPNAYWARPGLQRSQPAS